MYEVSMTNYFLAADVSKGYADFVILDSDKSEVERSFQLDDTFGGHNELYNKLVEFCSQHIDCRIYAGLESTGGYENNWFYFLRKLQSELPLKVARLNPNEVHHTKKAEIKRNVTDRISASAIGYHLINTYPKIDFDNEDPYKSLKSIWTHVHMLVKQKTQLLNQFESFVYQSHPQLLPYCKEGVPEWVLKLIIEYPTAKHLARGHVSKISRIPYVTQQRAQELKKEAKHSIASSIDEDMGMLLSDLSQNILSYKQKIRKWKAVLKKKCDIPEVKLLITIPGVAEYTAVGLMLNMGSIEKFDSSKALASYWGLHPEFKISGDGKKKIGMSKKGRVVPRELLFGSVMSSIAQDTYVRKLYDYYVEKQGKNGMCAIGILMHKLARMIYGMLKNRTTYDPDVDKHNRNKTQREKSQSLNNDKSRRYQKYDPKAPISGRENKRRKEQIETQDALTSSAGSSDLPFSKKKIKKINLMSNENMEFIENNI